MTANPLVSGAIDRPKSAWAGVWPAEDIELIARGVHNKSWVDGTLGAVGAGLDGLALVSDPVGALLQYGIAWLIEHVKPLSEALDWLAGDPGAIAGHARTWRNVAESLRSESDELVRAVRFDLTEWQGAASDAYRTWADQRDQSLQALAKASDTMALITEGAGLLIATVRMMVRDAVATVVSRLIVYAGELIASLGTATPLVVEQVSTLCASWAAKIARWLRDLISSPSTFLRENDTDMPEMTEAERRWESWYQAFIKVFEAFPQPTDVPCPEKDGGYIRLTFYGYPDSRTGSVTAWCDRNHHGIWLGRVGIPAGARTYPFDSRPENQPEIELIPEAWYTPDSDDEGDDLVP